MSNMLDRRGDDLEHENAELRRQLELCGAKLKEAREQQTATSEILGVISRSPTGVQPVFDAIVAGAARLCEAEFTAVARLDEGLLQLVAINNLSPEETVAFHSLFPRPPAPNFAMGRAILDGRPVQFEDALAEPDYDARTLEVLQSVAQYRSFLGVPIFREGKPIGVIGCARRRGKPFTNAQIELVSTFADQAAIALENIRPFDELQSRNREVNEALEQQTATAEVLQVINSSPGDLAPVFDAILEKAHTLCGAPQGALMMFDGQYFRASATRGLPEPFTELLRGGFPVSPGSPFEALIGGERLVHFADVANSEAYRAGIPGARATRSSLPATASKRSKVFASCCPIWCCSTS